MKNILKYILILILFCFVAIVSIYIYWFFDAKNIVNIDKYENKGVEYIDKLNDLITSNWSWKTKDKAVFSVGKILDDSSIPFLVNQLNYKGHWWQFWWDKEDVNKANIFRENVMYTLKLYGDSSLDYLTSKLEVKNQKKSRNLIIAIGVLETKAAKEYLSNLKTNQTWTNSKDVIIEALNIVEKQEDSNINILLKEKDIEKAIQELETIIKKYPTPIEEIHLNALILDLGMLKVEQSRSVLKKIIEGKYSELLKASAIKALGNIQNANDIDFIAKYVFNNDIDIRREAIRSISEFKSEKIIPILTKVLDQKYEAPRNKMIAKKGLENLGKSST